MASLLFHKLQHLYDGPSALIVGLRQIAEKESKLEPEDAQLLFAVHIADITEHKLKAADTVLCKEPQMSAEQTSLDTPYCR